MLLNSRDDTPSLSTPLPFNLQSFKEARWERNAYLSCAALIIYEYFLQLDSEVELFWKQRWSLAKGLFIWSRYYALAFNISNAFIFNLHLLSTCEYISTVLYDGLTKASQTRHRCSTFFHWQNTGASLQAITTHIILQLRLYAMYESSRKILSLFVFLTLGEALVMGIVFGVPNGKVVATNEPFEDNFICADGDPLDGTHWVVYYWSPILVIEGVLLALALFKAWQHRTTANGSSIMQELTKESVIYFFTIFWIYLANLILWFHNRLTLDELGTAFSFVVANIFANRLVISVRRNYYRPSALDRDADACLPASTIRFSDTLDSGSSTAADDTTTLELIAFDERTGA